MPKTFVTGEETLAQKAHRQLRRRIIDGRLRPGQRLPLRPLASEMGMSMAPVGEALRELARDGILETEPGWGARVRRLDSDALRNQHILRTALECEAIRHCTARIAESQRRELAGLAGELDRRIDRHQDWKQVFELDSQFHLLIAERSGVRALVEALRANQLVRMLARGSLMAQHCEQPRRQHLSLVEAISTRDPQIAEQAMREHCLRSMELQISQFAANPSGI
ncbi:MAG: GntR family transcriptional regulator [Planctomycetales bacterium]